MEHIDEEVDITLPDLAMTCLLRDHIVCHHIDNEAMANVETLATIVSFLEE